jgi:hypothetical protein
LQSYLASAAFADNRLSTVVGSGDEGQMLAVIARRERANGCALCVGYSANVMVIALSGENTKARMCPSIPGTSAERHQSINARAAPKTIN